MAWFVTCLPGRQTVLWRACCAGGAAGINADVEVAAFARRSGSNFLSRQITATWNPQRA
jgi:hypothetical protein